MDVVQKMKPLCSDHRQLQSLVKEEIPSLLAANEGEGKNAPQVRRKQRMDRVEARVKKIYNELKPFEIKREKIKYFFVQNGIQRQKVTAHVSFSLKQD